VKSEKFEIMTLTRKTTILGIFFLTLLSLVILHQVVKVPDLPITRAEKRDREIEGILEKVLTSKLGVQYALVAAENGYYPCYNCVTPIIYLKRGEVWKYGKTCLNQRQRYNDLDEKNLTFIPQFAGTEEQCLIMEKQKIYNYFLLPKNIERATGTGTQPLMRPPGNKIDR
jgi:hypothetical protein